MRILIFSYNIYGKFSLCLHRITDLLKDDLVYTWSSQQQEHTFTSIKDEARQEDIFTAQGCTVDIKFMQILSSCCIITYTTKFIPGLSSSLKTNPIITTIQDVLLTDISSFYLTRSVQFIFYLFFSCE